MLRLNLLREPTAKAWFFRLLMGPALILDGIVSSLSMGFINCSAAMNTAKRLAKARHEYAASKEQP